MAATFVQPCETCGRRLQVNVRLLGETLVCQHCGSEFIAKDQSLAPSANSESVDQWIQLAEQAISTATVDE